MSGLGLAPVLGAMQLHWMVLPVVVCLLSMAALGWFGLHVLQRGVIFVDLALAQIAALGATYAVFLGHEADSPIALGMALAFTAAGALAFATLREFEDRVPQEALIGISYAVSAALGVLMIELASDPHGAEKLQHLLVGNIVWVQEGEILRAAVAIGLVGLVHLAFGRRFLQISFDHEAAAERGARVAAWDLLFYLSFGVVLTAIVNIIGVLLVFSFLVIPAVVGRLFAEGIGARLAIAYGLGFGASVVGVAISYEHSTGPIVVALLGACLLLSLVVVAVRQAPSPLIRLASITGAGVVIGGALWGASALLPEEHAGHEHAEHGDHPGLIEDLPAPGKATELDPLTRLELATVQARAGDPRGLGILAALVQEEAPFIRMEADGVLRSLAGEAAPVYDPLAGPDVDGLWRAWARSPGEDWAERAGP